MNLLEHYVLKIYSEKDITDKFEFHVGYRPFEKLYLLDMEIECYGKRERVQKKCYEAEYNAIKNKGYYLA